MVEVSTRYVEKSDYYESNFLPEKMDIVYPPVARTIMWCYSQHNQLMENLIAIRALNLP